VIRRCRTTLVLAALVAVGVAGATDRARASGIATYQLTNTGTTPLTQIIAEILPANSVAPPSQAVNPLTILSGSKGFDTTSLIDSLGSGKLANGDPLQVLELQFNGTGGLAPGGVVNFSLNLAPGYTGVAPTLMVESPTTGLSVLPYTPPVTDPSSGSGGSPQGGGSTGVPVTNQVPEPLSLTLWSVAAGLGLLRARAFRRARQLEC
jgi:hypothetical protein